MTMMELAVMLAISFGAFIVIVVLEVFLILAGAIGMLRLVSWCERNGYL